MAICRIVLSFERVRRVGVWFGLVRSALLLAVGTCVVLSVGAMPGLLSPCDTINIMLASMTTPEMQSSMH